MDNLLKRPKKSKFYIALLSLFLFVYTFVIFTRLAYGFSASFTISFLFTFLITSPIVLRTLDKTFFFKSKISRKAFLFYSFSCGVAFVAIRLYSSQESFSIPTYIIATVSSGLFFIATFFILDFFFSITQNKGLSIFTYTIALAMLFLFIQIILYAKHCTLQGCVISKVVSNEAIQKNDPKVCLEKSNSSILVRQDIPAPFKIKSDPFITGSFEESQKCLYDYQEAKPYDFAICSLKKESTEQYLCIYSILTALYRTDDEKLIGENIQPSKCESLQKINSGEQEDLTSLCYFIFAQFFNCKEENFCKNVDINGKFNRDYCNQLSFRLFSKDCANADQ